eukprot:22504_1
MDLGSEKYGNVPNVNVMRLSFTGLSGFEFHLSNEHLYCLYDNIIKIARDNEFKVCDFGAYALDSMRMEVGFKFLGSDMRRDDTAVMCSPLNNSTNNSTNNMTVTEAQSSNGIEQQRSYAVSPLNSTAEVQSSNAVEPQRSYAVSPLISTAEVQSSNAVEPQRSYAASPLTEAQSSNAIERQRSYAAGRPIRCNSLYPVFKKEKGCVFGFHNGLEQPLYFNNHDGIYAPSSRRSNWFENVRQEVETTVESLGVMDMSTFSKILVRGEDAYQFLDTLVANQVPKKIGRVCIARMLTPSCKVTAETTICRLSKDEFYVVTGSDMERHDLREFYRHKDAQQLANVEFVSVTNDWSVLSIAGPNAEAVLSQLSYG